MREREAKKPKLAALPSKKPPEPKSLPLNHYFKPGGNPAPIPESSALSKPPPPPVVKRSSLDSYFKR